MVGVSRTPLDYETPERRDNGAAHFWIAFAVAAVMGLVMASVIDDLIYRSRTGHHADCGVTIISVIGIPLAAIVAVAVRHRRKRATWGVAAICGLVAAPIVVVILYAFP